ncbi:chaplin [Actinomadura fibrosa]|uniref:Chaplin n=1 Tax=Actinomadura fibrosa TaxID=111802 RepID=A0ABW2XV25_9ACTN
MIMMGAAAAAVATTTVPAGADVDVEVKNSPGIVSGNLVQAPVDVPVNACGNTITVVGALNPTFGNVCEDV